MVYPRACGGTQQLRIIIRGAAGLSPRVRGNRFDKIFRKILTGSIPARAGEPQDPRAARVAPGVYPRACGGTYLYCQNDQEIYGLSPRVRGNLYFGRHKPAKVGSIPARAGEPDRHDHHPAADQVYPRACGGTPRWLGRLDGIRGLSPRVRGNLDDQEATIALAGSIPARAGEPALHWLTGMETKVYPRACGGTFC